MKEATIIMQFQQMYKSVHALAEGFKINVLSQNVGSQALENLLIKKGVFTREEMQDAIRDEAKAMVEKSSQQHLASTEATPTVDQPIEEVPAEEPTPEGTDRAGEAQVDKAK